MTHHYDRIGINYADLRKPDPRIEQMIWHALGSARTVLNVGAGAGSYEPLDRHVTALEPSIAMIRQRQPFRPTAIQGAAEDLPFEDDSFDASMAILTVHHWTDQAQGLREMRRVTRGKIVILTYDPTIGGFWLADYIPALVSLDEAQMPAMASYEHSLGPVRIVPVPIPRDCTDGFLCAYWQRPTAYLDPRIRAAMSSFWAIGDVGDTLERLEDDLQTGVWAERYGHVLDLETADFGYRLVISD